jgi:hypothetical protein
MYGRCAITFDVVGRKQANEMRIVYLLNIPTQQQQRQDVNKGEEKERKKERRFEGR